MIDLPVFSQCAVCTRWQLETGGNSFEQLEQLRPFGVRQPFADASFVLLCEFERTPEQLVSRVCEMEAPHAPVARIWPPLEQLALLESIDDRHHAARGNVQAFGKRL